MDEMQTKAENIFDKIPYKRLILYTSAIISCTVLVVQFFHNNQINLQEKQIDILESQLNGFTNLLDEERISSEKIVHELKEIIDDQNHVIDSLNAMIRKSPIPVRKASQSQKLLVQIVQLVNEGTQIKELNSTQIDSYEKFQAWRQKCLVFIEKLGSPYTETYYKIYEVDTEIAFTDFPHLASYRVNKGVGILTRLERIFRN